MKVYHAYGYAVKQKDIHSLETEWDCRSVFCEVFFDFDEAKQFLVSNFDRRLKDIYRNDCRFAGSPPDYGDIDKSDDCWRREYIDEYINYTLLIIEIDTDIRDGTKIDFTSPPRIKHYIRFTGEECTRDYVFGDKEYELRESDLLPEAGTKFNVGDLVRYADWEYVDNYRGALIVLESPQKPIDKSEPWENIYKLLHFDYWAHGGVRTETVDLHEADLVLYDEELLECNRYKDEIVLLQKIVNGELSVPRQLKEQILGGKISFDKRPSWREFSELNNK